MCGCCAQIVTQDNCTYCSLFSLLHIHDFFPKVVYDHNLIASAKKERTNEPTTEHGSTCESTTLSNSFYHNPNIRTGSPIKCSKELPFFFCVCRPFLHCVNGCAVWCNSVLGAKMASFVFFTWTLLRKTTKQWCVCVSPVCGRERERACCQYAMHFCVSILHGMTEND